MNIIISLLRDWGTDPLVWVAATGFPLIWVAVRNLGEPIRSTGRSNQRSGGRRFWPWAFSLLWLAVLMLVSAPRVVNPLVDAWETQYPLDASCGNDSAIVVLAGGLDRKATSAEQTEYLYPSSHIRSARAASMASKDVGVPILVTGKGLYQVSEAAMMRAYLTQRSIDVNRIVMDEAARNTYESAVNTAAIVTQNGWSPEIRLVTSALHMPRAIGVFEQQGLTPCAVPVEFLAVLGVPWWAMVPQTTALSKFRTYLHERIGTVMYRSKGWLS